MTLIGYLVPSLWHCSEGLEGVASLEEAWQWGRLLGFKSPHQYQYLSLCFMAVNGGVCSQLLSQWHACWPVGHGGTHRQDFQKCMCTHKHISHAQKLSSNTKISKDFILNNMVMFYLNSIYHRLYFAPVWLKYDKGQCSSEYFSMVLHYNTMLLTSYTTFHVVAMVLICR